MPIVVLDTNIVVAALLRDGGSARTVLRACLNGQYQPVLGPALLAEYEDVLGRSALFAKSRLNAAQRSELLDIFLANCRWTRIYFGWRPNLRDEGDNHLVELAVAGGATHIVTRNLRDLRGMELSFPGLAVVTPVQLLAKEPPR